MNDYIVIKDMAGVNLYSTCGKRLHHIQTQISLIWLSPTYHGFLLNVIF